MYFFFKKRFKDFMQPFFGHGLLQDCFLLQPDIINFNHGSFGTVPKPVMDAHFRLLMEQESCPEVWFRKTFYEYIEKSRNSIAALINSDLGDVVVLENASSAVNSILRSFPFKEGDKVLVLSSAYQMVVETLKFLVTTLKVEIVTVNIPYPLCTEHELITAVEQTLTNIPSIKMCIFSHISSMPTIIEPVKELTRICKSHGTMVIIDGAHAPGVIDIDVKDIGADYYLGNCHKWLFCPKGSAFLWASPENHPLQYPQPVVISSTGKYDYIDRFAYTGTRDYIALCAIPEGIAFIEKQFGGMANMRQYCRSLLQKGCDLLVTKWNTSYLTPISKEAFMANVILPLSTEEAAKRLQTLLFESYKLTMVYGCVPRRADEIENGGSQQIFFVRISSQVYLEYSDFEFLAEKVLSILDEISCLQWRLLLTPDDNEVYVRNNMEYCHLCSIYTLFFPSCDVWYGESYGGSGFLWEEDVYQKGRPVAGSQSNAMRALALLAKSTQKKFIYFSRPIPKVLFSQPIGNFKDALDAEMKVVELDRTEYNHLPTMKSTNDFLHSSIMKHSERASFLENYHASDVVFVPQGGAMDSARDGIQDLCQELSDFIAQEATRTNSNRKSWKIYFASGTGTMALFAAQYFAMHKTMDKSSVEVIAIPCVGDEKILLQNMKELDERTGNVGIFPSISSTASASKNSFGNPCSLHYKTWRQLQESSNIMFDLLYAPRAFEVLLSGCGGFDSTDSTSFSLEKLDPESNIIYYHCGGVEGNRSQLKRYDYLKIS